MDPHDRIFNIIFSKADEITWQSIIYELVKNEQMDPWDIDVSILAQKYIDMLLIGVEEEMEELGFDETSEITKLDEITSLIPKTPQPRKRKVSIFDLVEALERALEVKKRRLLHSIPPLNLEAPKKKKDVTEIIREVYGRIRLFFVNALQGKLTFTKLLPSESKEDKVHTLIPLLHLAQQNKIELVQESHFGEIEILLKRKEENPENKAEAAAKQ